MAASDGVARGVLYAFGRGMDPRAKDGVRAHPWVLVAGMLLHAGIVAAIVCVSMALVGAFPAAWVRVTLGVLTVSGTLGGLLLLLRRLREPVLQAISVTDDYISNLLVVALLVTASAFLLFPQRGTALLVLAGAVTAYAPFGKIRHCVLFFVTRARFGAFIGTRGVLAGRSRS